MKNKLQPTRTSFSRNFQCKKAPRWLSKFFHFGTENRADQLKNHPAKENIEIISCLDQGLVMADAKITVLSCMADCFFHISGFDMGFA